MKGRIGMNKIVWRTEKRKIGELIEWSKNPRKMSRYEFEHIKKSIDKFGIADPLIVNFDGTIIGGHQRKKVLLDAGLLKPEDEIDVRIPDRQLSTREAEELAIRLNKNTGSWDFDLLMENFEMPDLIEWGFTESELQIYGGAEINKSKDIDNMDINDAAPQIDKLEQLLKEWNTADGQLWELPSTKNNKSHRLLCGDSTDPADVHRLMGDERAILFATDPPYSVNYTGNRKKFVDGKSIEVDKDWSRYYNDAGENDLQTDNNLYDEFIKAAKEYAIKENAAWYCWYASRCHCSIENIWIDNDAFVHQIIIWRKDKPLFGHSWYMWQTENCFFGWIKGNKPPKINKDDVITNLWDYSFPYSDRVEHPTQKPIELFMIPIMQHVEVGGLCYEPFSGSGTQIMAAENLGRICYAMEISPAFVAVALQRYYDATGTKPVLVE